MNDLEQSNMQPVTQIGLTPHIQEMMRRAARIKDQVEKNPHQHLGVPSWFRATCRAAAAGGSTDYEVAGSKLACALGTEEPIGLSTDEWDEHVEVLRSHCNHRDVDAIWSWFLDHYPRAMRCVPKRRRDRFVDGVIEAYTETEGLPL